MKTPPSSSAFAVVVREWLRNERRLGIRHMGFNLSPYQAAPGGGSAGRRKQSTSPRSGRAATGSEAAAPSLSASEAGPTALPAACDRELPDAEARQALQVLDDNWVKGCTACALHSGRTQTVFGTGRARPEIVFVGEGPGADADQQGEPFVGRAGKLLTRMIAAMTLTRDQVYICNVVKCRPPNNRTPTEDEMRACAPYLIRQLAILRPRVIVTLGRPAAQTLLDTKTPIGKLRGQFHRFPPAIWADYGLPETPVMPTFHPAYLLRSPGEKARAWEDLQQVMEFLGIPIPQR